MNIDKVKVVSSPVPRPSHCSVWPSLSVHGRPNWLEEVEEERGCTAATACQTQKASISL